MLFIARKSLNPGSPCGVKRAFGIGWGEEAWYGMLGFKGMNEEGQIVLYEGELVTCCCYFEFS